MRHLHRFGKGQVGDAARDLEHAVRAAGRPAQAGCGDLQQPGGRIVELQVLVDLLALQQVVAFSLPAFGEVARGDTPGTDVGGALAGGLAQQVAGGDGRHVHMQVDAVHQRATQAPLVTRHLIGGTAAGSVGRTEVAARAGVHRGDQLEARRELAAPRRARNGDGACLQGLAQRLQRGTGEFWQLVEEQYAMVGQ